jgi:hypothetical protein
MYVFARDGILSIVAHDSKPGMLLVRSPVRADIEHYWPAAKIVRTDDGDYLFRTTLSREVVAARIAETIARIDYPKVKPAVSAERELAYFEASSVIMSVQDAQDVRP